MKKTELYVKVNQGLSIAKIAKYFEVCPSTIRYWMGKYKLKTLNAREQINNRKCKICGIQLIGMQKMYCSNNCKSRGHYKNSIQGNSMHRQKRVSLERKIFFIKQLGGGCSNCGYNKNLSAMEFHHKDPSTKDFPLDARRFGNNSMKTLEIEVNKCELLCSNCHREHHHPQLEMKKVLDFLSTGEGD